MYHMLCQYRGNIFVVTDTKYGQYDLGLSEENFVLDRHLPWEWAMEIQV